MTNYSLLNTTHLYIVNLLVTLCPYYAHIIIYMPLLVVTIVLLNNIIISIILHLLPQTPQIKNIAVSTVRNMTLFTVYMLYTVVLNHTG